jgi:hypothetical protein
MSLRSRLDRLDRSRRTPGHCPECDARPGDVRCMVVIAPPETEREYFPPRLETTAPPRFCSTRGQRFPIPILSVQHGDVDSPLIADLLRDAKGVNR